MCQPRKWWWGLLPLVALWVGSMLVLAPQLEEELVHRVKSTVGRELPWMKMAIDGRDIYIEGAAPSLDAQTKAMNSILETDGVRLAINAAGLIPEAKPFTWGAIRADGKLTLTGHVAADGSREQLVAEARKLVPGTTIVDEMKEARGAPAAAVAMSASALAVLAKLRSGSVALVDETLAVKGMAPDQAAATALVAATKKLPAPIKVGTVEVGAPAATVAVAPPPKAPAIPIERPYVWQGVRDGNAVTLSGSVPSDAARAQALAAAKSTLGGGRVVDQMKIASGLPQSVDYAAATGFALAQLGQMRTGTARLSDGKLVLDGEALDASAYRAITTAAAGSLPGGLTLDKSNIVPPKAANYAWSARREGKTLVLTGYYPDEGTRYMMKQAVAQRFAGLDLDDKTQIASGAPAGFSAAMGMGLDQLSQLDSGEAAIAKGRLTISGMAPDEKTAAEVKEALTKLVGGMPSEAKLTVAAAAPSVAPPPAPPAPPAAGPVAAAPSPPAAAPAPAPAVPAPVASVAPAPPASPAPATAAAVPKAEPAPVTTPSAPPPKPAPVVAAAPKPSAPPPAVTAKPPAPATAAAAKAPPVAAPAAPSAKTAATAAAVATAACPAQGGKAIETGRIRFGSSSSEVLPSSRKAVVGVAGVMKRCAGLKIEIGGHTDATGSLAYNEALSKSRAEAIRAILVKQGVEVARIKTAGYGPAKPVADNVTPAGKAQNRRIEFTVVE